MEKATSKQTIALFWQHLRKYPKYVVSLAVIAPLCVVLHQFIPPLIISNVLNRLSEGDFVPDQLWQSFGTEIFLYGTVFILGTVIGWRLVIMLIWRLEALVTRDMSRRIFSHLLSQSAPFHANKFGGSLVSQTSKFTSAYIRFTDTTVFNMNMLVVGFIATIVILLPIAPLFVLALCLFAVAYVAVAFFSTRRIRELNVKEAAATNRQTGQLADSITNVMAVKSFAAADYENHRFAKATNETYNSTLNLMRASLRRDLQFASINATIMIGALIVALMSVVIFENADIAVVFLVLTYAGNISRHLWDFSTKTLRNYNRAMGDAREMTGILLQPPDVQDPSHPESVHINKGAIAFEDVTFAHADAENDALFKDFNLAIQSGEKIGLVGHSGSGKTTLTKLLLRYNDINHGAITIDGQNIALIKQDDLRRHIAYVPQEPLLFHRSLHENIAYGKPEATAEEVQRAAKKAHAAEFIAKLPHGYETTVGERGIKLSGGQRQRIAIARAILKDAPILVLDEATSALDSESEVFIQEALWELMKNRTAIVIAHRLSTIQKMDRIVVLEDGRIKEQGTHRQLLRKKGTYAELWKHQSGGFIEE